MTASEPKPVDNLESQLERHHRESFGWARLCCRQDPEEAENVLQSVYLKILERRAVFDGRSTFRTWLFSVIRITAQETRRRRFLEILRLKSYSPPQPTAHDSETERTVRAALALLPKRQAEALQLVFYHELTIAEAATVMGVSLGSARTHYERGKKKLRPLLEHL